MKLDIMILSLYFNHFRDICIFSCIVLKICKLPSIWFPLKVGFSNIQFHSCGLHLSAVLSAPIIGASSRHKPMMRAWEETGDSTATILSISISRLMTFHQFCTPQQMERQHSALRIVELATEAKLLVRNLDREWRKAFKNCWHR